ncbi:hypothetical protein MNB_SM-3-1036 [hydrothermal vent metagenome]|uniref:Uncharacterized protein n=1 Tax=hydrothermal vent metagenome TaxID=652676 RepID=A0A1W1D4R2_9ZZZZ
MKKFNLLKEIIVVDKNAFLQAINSQKIFAITTQGEVIYDNFEKHMPLIYKGKFTPNSPLSTEPFNIATTLGKNYQVVEDGNRILIKAFANWQELLPLHLPYASYDDTTADGVMEFANKELEKIGWYADEFNISYRNLVEVLEEKCDGILFCIEKEEPYHFSGMGFLSDDEQAKEVLFSYCQETITNKIQNDEDFAKENLTDDEEEAARFFQVL